MSCLWRALCSEQSRIQIHGGLESRFKRRYRRFKNGGVLRPWKKIDTGSIQYQVVLVEKDEKARGLE